MKKYNSISEIIEDFDKRIDNYNHMAFAWNLSRKDRLEFFAACYDLYPRVYEQKQYYFCNENGKVGKHPFDIVTGIYNADWIAPMWIIYLPDVDRFEETSAKFIFVDAPDF